MVRTCRGTVAVIMALIMAASSLVCPVVQDRAYAASKTSSGTKKPIQSRRKWGKKVSDRKLNKLNGTNYYTYLPGVNMYACVGYAEWALKEVYKTKPVVPSYSLVRYLRADFIRHGNPVVAYGSYVSEEEGGDGEYIEKGEIRPGDIVFFFHRGRGKKSGKVKKKPIGNTRGEVSTNGIHFWTHVAVASGEGKGINIKLHDNSTGNPGEGIAMSSTIRTILEKTGAYSATDYQVFRVLRQGKGRVYVKVSYEKKSWYDKEPKLSGAKFEIAGQKLKTDGKGKTEKTKKLSEKKYPVKQVRAPKGFKAVKPKEKKAKVTQFKSKKVVFVNEPVIARHKIFIRKKNKKAKGNYEGAVFRVWPVEYGKYSTEDGWWKKIPAEVRTTVTVDSSGKVKTKKLPSNSKVFTGRYYVHQIKAPEGSESTVVNRKVRLKKSRRTISW